MAKQQVAVVGGGLGGLMTALKLAEAGAQVDLFSVVPVKRSHSVCAQGGINGAVNTKGEGDSPWIHFDDSVYGGDFLGNQPPIQRMTERAPAMIYLLDRMGVPFNRTNEGLLDFRRFGGTRHHRTAFSGSTTGQQLLYALDEQVRMWEVEGRVTKYEGWEFIGLVIDEAGVCRGMVAQDMRSMEIRAFREEAVVIATGGPGMIYQNTTNSIICTGSAASICYQRGAFYGNGEFIQIHPTAIPGEDKCRLVSEGVRGEGGRVWVPKDVDDKRQPASIPESERWYFLEEKYPAYGNLVPRDVATREIFDVCINQRRGVHGKTQVYLDITHLPKQQVEKKLLGILEVYIKFVGEDPRETPMRVYPAQHYSMGGMWVDFAVNSEGLMEMVHPRNQMTNIPGLYAVGEVDYQYHGANRLGANSLLSCLFGGEVTGPAVKAYIQNLEQSAMDAPQSLFDAEQKKQQDQFQHLSQQQGAENPYKLAEEMRIVMEENVSVVRENAKLKMALDKLYEIRERAKNVSVLDHAGWTNQAIPFARNLGHQIELALAITKGALLRDESRGAHYKPEFPQRDDERFLKTSMAKWTPDGPEISFEAVDTSLITPRARRYDVASKTEEKKTDAVTASVKS
ncbi:MAG: succinate dehydrogenase flavoprotein subunit [Fimbriimonadia bacterium]|nr:succinate dehydrogenase flavoprotein subunit [Fimbriimonadia bacterium]